MVERRHRRPGFSVNAGLPPTLESLPQDRADVRALVELVRQLDRQSAYLTGLRAAIYRGTFRPEQAPRDITRICADATETAVALNRVATVGARAWHEGQTL